MFMDYPLVEAGFRLVVWVLVGVPIALVIWSIGSAFIVASLTVVALQLGVVIAFAGYLIGIPWSMWFRLRHGRWPE